MGERRQSGCSPWAVHSALGSRPCPSAASACLFLRGSGHGMFFPTTDRRGDCFPMACVLRQASCTLVAQALFQQCFCWRKKGYYSVFAGFTAHVYWYKHILVWLQIVWPEVPVSIMMIHHTQGLTLSSLSQSRFPSQREWKTDCLAGHTQSSLHFNIPRSK